MAVPDPEMRQNSGRIAWKQAGLQRHPADTMRGIQQRCVEHGGVDGRARVDDVCGAHIAGFRKVAEAMRTYGVV